MVEEDIFAENQLVFSKPTRNDRFGFYKVLVVVARLCMSIPPVSTHFQWTAMQVASLAGQGAIYILADEELFLPVSIFSKLIGKPFFITAMIF